VTVSRQFGDDDDGDALASRGRLSTTPTILPSPMGWAITWRIASRLSCGLITNPMSCPIVGSQSQASVWDSQFCLITGAFPRHHSRNMAPIPLEPRPEFPAKGSFRFRSLLRVVIWPRSSSTVENR
jgi:hypothetical protein